jgi:hypothetical protein
MALRSISTIFVVVIGGIIRGVRFTTLSFADASKMFSGNMFAIPSAIKVLVTPFPGKVLDFCDFSRFLGRWFLQFSSIWIWCRQHTFGKTRAWREPYSPLTINNWDCKVEMVAVRASTRGSACLVHRPKLLILLYLSSSLSSSSNIGRD